MPNLRMLHFRPNITVCRRGVAKDIPWPWGGLEGGTTFFSYAGIYRQLRSEAQVAAAVAGGEEPGRTLRLGGLALEAAPSELREEACAQLWRVIAVAFPLLRLGTTLLLVLFLALCRAAIASLGLDRERRRRRRRRRAARIGRGRFLMMIWRRRARLEQTLSRENERKGEFEYIAQ